jgi:hypothetical protein
MHINFISLKKTGIRITTMVDSVSLREELFQKYLRDLFLLEPNVLCSPLLLTRQHVDWKLSLDREFRTRMKSKVRDNPLVRKSYGFQHALLLDQLDVTLNAAKSWFVGHENTQAPDFHKLQTIENKLTATRGMQDQLTLALKQCKVQLESFEKAIPELSQKILDCLKKSLCLTQEARTLYVDAKKETKKHSSSWFDSLIKVAFVIAASYISSCVIGSMCSSCVETPSGLSLLNLNSHKLSANIGQTIKRSSDHVHLPFSDVVQSISQSLMKCESQQGLQSLIPFSLPSVQPSLQPSKPKCSLQGYWHALVNGFSKEGEYSILATEGSEGLLAQFDTPWEEMGGHLGLFLKGKGADVITSVSKYRQSCG